MEPVSIFQSSYDRWELRMAAAIVLNHTRRGIGTEEALALITPPARATVREYVRELLLLPRGWALQLCREVFS